MGSKQLSAIALIQECEEYLSDNHTQGSKSAIAVNTISTGSELHKKMKAVLQLPEDASEQTCIDWDLLSIRLLDIACHYNKNADEVTIRNAMLTAIQAAILPLPYKAWEPELMKKTEAIEFEEWCADSDKYVRVQDECGNKIWIDQETPETENNGDYYRFTTIQLYSLFLTYKNKKTCVSA